MIQKIMDSKRKTKWYRKNEKEIMEMLGLKNTKNSGAGWIEKEDGYNDKIICQLKSTDKGSIKIQKLDLEKLEHNSIVSHKIPIFAIQFINKDVYLLMKPIDIPIVYKYINTGKVESKDEIIVKNKKQKKVKAIKSNSKLRQKFFEEKQNKYKKSKPTIYNFTK